MTPEKKEIKEDKNKKELKLIRTHRTNQNLKILIITKDAVLNETFYILLFHSPYRIIYILKLKYCIKVISIY